MLFTIAPPIPYRRIPKQMTMSSSDRKYGAGPEKSIAKMKMKMPHATILPKFLDYSGMKFSKTEVRV